MAVGKEILSAFAGAADYLSFDLVEHELSTLGDVEEMNDEDKELNRLYAEVREVRENPPLPAASPPKGEKLISLFEILRDKFPNDWLLPLEIYELTGALEILDYLKELQKRRPDVAHLIEGGLGILKK